MPSFFDDPKNIEMANRALSAKNSSFAVPTPGPLPEPTQEPVSSDQNVGYLPGPLEGVGYMGGRALEATGYGLGQSIPAVKTAIGSAISYPFKKIAAGGSRAFEEMQPGITKEPSGAKLVSQETPSRVPIITGKDHDQIEMGQVDRQIGQSAGDLLSQGYGQIEQGIKTAGAVGASLAIARAQEAKVLSAQQERLALEHQEAETSRRDYLSKVDTLRMDKLDEMRRLADKQTTWWEDASMPKKILAGVVLIASGATRRDLGASIVENIVNREAERQRLGYETAKLGSEIYDRRYGQLVQAYGDERVADHEFRSEMKQLAIDKLGQLDLQRAPSLIRANVEKTLGELKVSQFKDIQDSQFRQAQMFNALYSAKSTGVPRSMPAETAGKFALALSGLRDIQQVGTTLGTIDWNILGDSEKAQAIRTLEESLVRFFTGSGVAKAEWKKFRQLVPKAKDSQKEANSKMERLTGLLTTEIVAMDPTGGYRQLAQQAKSGTLEETIKGQRPTEVGFEEISY